MEMEDLLPALADLGTGRDWNRGRELFKKGVCGGCHAFGSDSEGTGLAPEQQPFTRLTLDKAGKVTRTETIFTPVSEAIGITWHDKSLYVQGGRLPEKFTKTIDNPGFGRQSGQAGLHRLRDPKGDGSFDDVTTLRTWDGPEGGHSDHGIHEARVSPDGKHFYIINGNGVVPPDDVSPNSPLRNYADDRIIPLLGAQTGRLGQDKAPGGTIARTTFDGKDLHLVSGGMRNALHFDWNADGGSSRSTATWSRSSASPGIVPCASSGCRVPRTSAIAATAASTRAVRGSLPPLVEIGLGSPVGVTFGYRTAFPALYQRALFVADNNYGRIIAVHLKPAGSGYVATSWENVVWPKSLYGATPRMPHNVTDMIIARDGTFYYVIGNRRTQSYVIRLRIQKLRVIEVAVSRNGKPSDAAVQRVIADVDAVLPGSSFELNTEMSQIPRRV